MSATTCTRLSRRARGLLAVCLVAPAAAGQAESAPLLPTYEARYEVEYRGRNVGVSDFSVSYDAARAVYVFESRTAATGLLRLLRSDPAIERSEFVLHDGGIEPLEFRFDDGTRKGEDDLHIVFDRASGLAAVTTEAGSSQVPLQAGALDRGTMQVAFMLDLARGVAPGPYVLVDGDSLKTYRYTAVGREPLTIESGTYDTLLFTQRRDDSSRVTRIWVAPSLAYLPVRIEQVRDGEVQTSLTLGSVAGLGGTPLPGGE